MRLTFALSVFVGVCLPSSSVLASQTSLEDYRARIHEAVVALDSLAALGEDVASVDASDGRTRRAVARRTLEQVRTNLPPRERIVWSGGEFETDNRWLHESLANYERTDLASSSEGAAALAALAERLRGIEEGLTEVEAASAGENALNDKDAAKARLDSILQRAEYNGGTRGESALSRFGNWLWEMLMKILRRILPRGPSIAPGGGGGALISIVQIVIVTIIIALLAFLAWKLTPIIKSYLRSKRAAAAPRARIVLGEVIEAHKSAADLLIEAEAWARDGNTRAAIRKAYIALLCELGDRKILPLAQHKTNRDYLRDVQTRRALYDEMHPLTANFERHWYGFQPASEMDWQDFRAHCRKAMSGIADCRLPIADL